MSRTEKILKVLEDVANLLDTPVEVMSAGESLAAGAVEYMTDEETARAFCEEMQKGFDKCLRDYAKKKEKT